MLTRADKSIRERLNKLEIHLKNENPILVDAIKLFKKLDRVAYKIGLMDVTESYATRISWWPLISVLGTFSAGKSSFINQYLGCDLQATGNQAVDDKFTVIPYSSIDSGRVLPGLALDSDPRFPFYKMSEELDKVAPGEGQRIDAYLQLKTANSEKLNGKIFIDSPGFDADEQRNSILRLTDHIIDLSDLVLVFFDARHPEPRAMQDTLRHLVASTVHRSDVEKFVFVLNQIDTAARDDNLEEVVAAWQRALAQSGLASGKFYTIYNKHNAVYIEDEKVRERFESRCGKDMNSIIERINQVETSRSYRIIGAIKNIVSSIENEVVPALTRHINSWRKYVLLIDTGIFGIVTILLALINSQVDISALFDINLNQALFTSSAKIFIIVCVVAGVHFLSRNFARQLVLRKISDPVLAGDMSKAFLKNTTSMRSVFQVNPRGWSSRSKRFLAGIVSGAGELIQKMNDRFTDPSGSVEVAPPQLAEVLSVVRPDQKNKTA